jgi:Na+/melibiose symporter-like transporter
VLRRSALSSEFKKLWAALSISLMGSQITLLALPVFAALTLRVSAFQMGVLAAAGQVPFLLCSLPAGILVDRLPRRPILVTADLGSALLLLTVPLAVPFGGPGFAQLCMVAFGVGTFQVISEVAHYSYVPTVVSRQQLTQSNSRLQVSYSAAEAAGPGMAGVLIQALTGPVAVLADAASFIASAILLRSIRRREQRPEAAPRVSLRRSLTDGLQMLFGHHLLRPIIISGAAVALFENSILAIYVLYATRRLGLNPLTIGVIFAAGGAGAIPGAMLARWAGNRFGIGPAIIGGLLLAALAGLLVPLAAGPAAIVIALLAASKALGALTYTVANIHQWSLRQAVTPDALAGRVTAGQRFIVYGIGSVGALLGGALGAAFGLRPALFICATGAVLAPLYALFSPLRHLHQQPAGLDDQGMKILPG